MSTQESLDTFFEARAYLDAHDGASAEREILKQFLEDDDELVRSEVADFLIVSGGLDYEAIQDRINIEQSEMVLPRLWVALALADAGKSKEFLQTVSANSLTSYAKAYLSAAKYLSLKNASDLYDLCRIACLTDIPSSYSAIDLLEIVASERTGLMRELVDDLERQGSENLEKARAMLAAVAT